MTNKRKEVGIKKTKINKSNFIKPIRDEKSDFSILKDIKMFLKHNKK